MPWRLALLACPDCRTFPFAQGHANFSEYVPLFLLLLAMTEGQSLVRPLYLHILGCGFTVARALHASYSFVNGPFFWRVVGTIMTISPLGCVAIILLIHSL